MSKKKSKRRADVKSSIIVLLLIAILLIASTYAWFTANQTVTISTLNVNVQAANGLQISSDGTSWKAVLANEDIMPTTGKVEEKYSNNTNQIPTELKPVSTAGNVTAGKLDMFVGNVESDKNTDSPNYGKYVLTTTKLTEAKGTTGDFVAFDIFLKVDADTNIVLTKASDVTKGASEDKGLKNAARVAFIKAADGDVKATGALLTDIQGVVPTQPLIWEPNCNIHTDAAVNHGISNYGYTTENLKTNTVIPKYNGVKAATTNAVLLDSTDASVFGEVTPTYQTNASNNVDTDVFTLKAGITKVRVYLWVEGQDIDCENTASGTDINFDIQFQVK